VSSTQPPVADNAHRLLLVADLVGTLVFATEGAMAAINNDLDLLGVAVLAFATALGGGIIRDILLGDLPPASLRDKRYPLLVLAAGAVVFFLHHYVRAIPATVIQVLDAAGLALFAITGTEKAMMRRMNYLVAVLLGTITGVGGGTIRDILLAQIPNVLRFEVYATAALVGSACMVAARKLRFSTNLAAALGGTTCFLLRVLSLWRHWNLPRAH
jgi:uncharacterized membrane protein YeiH